jgi:ABC-type phosphate transport system substrate-binding protein
MRLSRKLLASVAAAATVAGLAARPAFADPPGGIVPRPADAVGVGDNTSQYLLDQLAYDFDTANPKASTLLYSWDAVNPDSQAIGDAIETKDGCAAIARPDGSGAGITALAAGARPTGNSTNYCIDYARSSRSRNSTDPPYGPGGVAFVALAGDAVTWASRDAASGGTDAPASLTTAQLVNIFECKDSNWDQVGGQDAPIEAFLPQSASGTRAFFLTALGGGVTPIVPGSCVSDLPTSGDPGGTLEENEGVNPALDTPEAIFIYSVGDYLAQAYHSAACFNSGCCPTAGGADVRPYYCTTGGPPCTPTAGKNLFGCDETGALQLNEIGGSKPATPWPLTSSTSNATINTGFDLMFQRTLYDVVRYDPDTADHIPGPEAGSPGGINLEQLFGADGYACTNETAETDIEDYGFLVTWPLSSCGLTG